MSQWFTPNSTDELISHGLADGDVVLINRRCGFLARASPWRGALCAAAKYGLSGDGRGMWDHAAVVHRKDGIPYLLEGDARGVTLRTFEERLLQDDDHQEITVLPLRGAGAERASESISNLIRQELDLRKSLEGFENFHDGASCENVVAVYRRMFAKPRRAAIGGDAFADAPTPESSSSRCSKPVCRYGAPLVASILQRLGVLDERADAAGVTPAALATLQLEGPAHYGKPITVRRM